MVAFTSSVGGCLGLGMVCLWFRAMGVGTILGRLLSGVGVDSRTFRFGNYAIGSRSQSEAMGLFTGLHRL